MVLGQQEKILKVGNLNTERVVIDVRDCVNAYYKLMISEKSSGKVYNVCGSEVHKMQYYTDELINASPLEYEEVKQKIYPPYYRDIDIQVQIGDTKELTEDTDWHPEIPLSKTMEDLLTYWLKKIGE